MKETITLSISKEEKALLMKKAKAQRLSLTSYIRLVSLNQARKDLNDIKLNNTDWNLLISELDNPSKPNEKLIKLFAK
ncbi:MAG: DUF1778 domain-containing protein [Bacilli bacterium]|nr:DUF1778 domain-containing protein [Bacilli bacterium]